MTSSLDHIPNPRSCEYYQFFTDKSSYQVYQEASNWRSGLWEGGKTLSWNCLVGVPQFILNRFIDLGKLACWTTQCLPICLVFKNSVNDLQTIAHEMNSELNYSKEELNKMNSELNYSEEEINKMKLELKILNLEIELKSISE